MTPLHRLLLRQIAATGPLTVAEYMAACLLHPRHGYYVAGTPLGRGGDFVTAPEISQMFGELLGLCLAQSWLDQGAPRPFALAELGPGRGTLMADMLRATRSIPGFHAAMRLHLVEASPTLRAAQDQALHEASPVWHDRADTLPDLPLFLVANEFFDALPVRQFLRDGSGWRERMVGAEGERLTFGLTDAAPLTALAHRLGDTETGGMVETCAPAEALAQHLGQRIADLGGTALIVDYGSRQSLGDTLQAVRRHRKEGPLDRPGQADLTAHVAFDPLIAAAPCAATPLTDQGVFLERLGITGRARALARGLDGAALETHVAAHRRLTHPQEMGHLFKALAFYPDSAPPPPGLTP